jgi:hypothetical protein
VRRHEGLSWMLDAGGPRVRRDAVAASGLIGSRIGSKSLLRGC